MKRFEYISSKDCANEQKRREFNARINNGELAIRGIVKAGTDYRIAITIFDDHAKTVTPTECKEMAIKLSSICNEVWGDRIFEKCGIRRDEEGDGGKTLEIRGKRRLSARDGGANYQQS